MKRYSLKRSAIALGLSGCILMGQLFSGAITATDGSTQIKAVSQQREIPTYEGNALYLDIIAKKDTRVRNVNLSVDGYIPGIDNPTSTSETATKWEGSRVYAGEISGEAVSWKVLKNDETAMLLLTDKVVAVKPFVTSYKEGYSHWEYMETYPTIEIDTVVNLLDYEKSEPEEGDVITYDQCSDWEFHQLGTHTHSFTPVKATKHFILDASEMKNPNYGFGSVASRIPEGMGEYNLMSRTSNFIYDPETGESSGYGDYLVTMKSDGTYEEILKIKTMAMQEAVYLDKTDIWYTTPADYDKTTFGVVGGEIDNPGQWRLTKAGPIGRLLECVAPNTLYVGETAKLTMLTDVEGEYNQTSLMLVNKDTGFLEAYGKIGEEGSGEKSFTVPQDLPEGKYDAYVYYENVHNNGMVDTVSGMYVFEVKVTTEKEIEGEPPVMEGLERRRINLNHQGALAGIDEESKIYFGKNSETNTLECEVIDAYTTGWSDTPTMLIATEDDRLVWIDEAWSCANEKQNTTTYAESETRKYLNGDGEGQFLEFFSQADKDALAVSTRDWMFEDATQPQGKYRHYFFVPLDHDKVFCLDLSESFRYTYGVIGEERKVKASPRNSNSRDRSATVRYDPAMNLRHDRIFYTAAISNYTEEISYEGRITGSNTYDYDAKTLEMAVVKDNGTELNTWKLTLYDGDTSFDAQVLDKKGKRGESLSVNVTSKGSGQYDQTSAIYEDINGNVAAYGRVSENLSGKMEVDIPRDLEPGTYTLHIFNETRASEIRTTDYASAEVTAQIEITGEEPEELEEEYSPDFTFSRDKLSEKPDTSKHNYEWVVTREASKTPFSKISDLGEREYRCKDCGDVYIKESIVNTGEGLVYGIFDWGEALEFFDYCNQIHDGVSFTHHYYPGVFVRPEYNLSAELLYEAMCEAVTAVTLKGSDTLNRTYAYSSLMGNGVSSGYGAFDFIMIGGIPRELMNDAEFANAAFFWHDTGDDARNFKSGFSIVINRKDELFIDYERNELCRGGIDGKKYTDMRDDLVLHGHPQTVYYKSVEPTNPNAEKVTSMDDLNKYPHLTDVAMNGQAISDLTPLSEMKCLKSLSLNDNNITDLSPLKGLQLEYLSLDGNNITDLSPLKGMPLKFLSINGNQITDLSVLEGMDLFYLDAADNQISSTKGISSTWIKSINLNNNKVTDISSLSACKNLRHVRLQNNKIKDISPLKDKKQLIVLELDNNEIESISSISNNTELMGLGITNNKLKNLNGIENLDISKIDFSHNEVTDLQAVAKNKNIKKVVGAYNKIRSLSFIEGTQGYTYLDLSHNKISDVSPISNYFFSDGLDLTYNRISDLIPIKNTYFTQQLLQTERRQRNKNLDFYTEQEVHEAKFAFVEDYKYSWKLGEGNYITLENAKECLPEEVYTLEEYKRILDEHGVLPARDENGYVLFEKTGKTWLDYQGFLELAVEVPKDDEILKGDCDGSGAVNLRDAVLVLKASLGITVINGDLAVAADVDSDGKITLSDATKVLRMALGIV